MSTFKNAKMSIAFRVIISVLILASLIAIFVYVNKEFSLSTSLSSHGDAPDGYDAFAAAVDTDFSLALAQQLSELGDDPVTGYRTSGSPAEKDAAILIEQTMKDIGLQNVTIDEANADTWVFKGANITYKNENDKDVKIDLGSYPIAISENMAKYQLVYVGRGYFADYNNIDVKDKIVLIEVDSDESFRAEFVVYQAYLQGAKVVLLVNEKDSIEKRLVNRNISGISAVPVLSISRKDANDLIHTISTLNIIDVSLTANNKITLNGSTNNVWGEIPGESDEVIYFSSHYDGYYRAFYDGATEVGLTLGIAKALVESGFKPQKTIRFVMNGAGKWGKSTALRHQNIGATQQVTMVRPEWAESIFTLFSINYGLPFPNSSQLTISVPLEFRSFLETTVHSFGDRAKKTEITVIGELPPMDRSDSVYRSIGIPTVTNNRSTDMSDYYEKMYHSSGDMYLESGFNKELAESIIQYYGYAALMFDELLIKPFDMETRVTEIKRSYGVEDALGEYVDSHLLANADRAIQSAQTLDAVVASINESYIKAKRDQDQVKIDEYLKRSPEIIDQLNYVYKLMQDNFYELNLQLEYEFGHEELQNNIAALNTAAKMINQGENIEAACDVLTEINISYYSTLFEKEVYEAILGRISSAAAATWDESLGTSKLCDVSDILISIDNKIAEGDNDFSKEIVEIERIRDEQAEVLKKLYSIQSFAYITIMDEINRIVDSNSAN